MSPSVKRTQILVRISLFAVLTYLGALIQLPMYPAPITMQTFMVILSGTLIGPVNGAISQLLYIAMGLLGLPVFSGGGGLGYVLDPRFGFIIGFIPLAAISGLGKGKSKAIYISFASIVLYIIGTTYIWFILNHVSGATAPYMGILKGMVVFLPGDIVKIALALVLTNKLVKRVGFGLRR